MNFLRRFWFWLTMSRFALCCDLACKAHQIAALQKTLEVETRRRESLERILHDTVHDSHPQPRPSTRVSVTTGWSGGCK